MCWCLVRVKKGVIQMEFKDELGNKSYHADVNDIVGLSSVYEYIDIDDKGSDCWQYEIMFQHMDDLHMEFKTEVKALESFYKIKNLTNL